VSRVRRSGLEGAARRPRSRSVQELAGIIQAAGIEAEQVTYFLPEDSVYCVVEIVHC